jgi:hypothetical protein
VRRAGRRVALVAAVALLVTAGGAVAARIGFTGETNSTNTVANGWIGPASGLSVTPSGYDAQLAWTPGTHGPVTGQTLYGVDNGTTSSCTGVTYALMNTMASATTAAFTKSNTSTVNGHWLCYQMQSTSASSWTSTANFPATQLGLVATSVAIANGTGAPGTMDSGDTITITFNQNVLASSVSTNPQICTGLSATVIFIGDTTGCKTTGDAYSIGVINGITVTGNKAKFNATAAVSGNQIVVTLAGSSGNTSGSGTFTPAAGIQSLAATDRANACTAPNCRPTTSGGF